jgi:hypothetical protein
MLKAASLSGLGVSSGLLRTAYSADIELESVQYSFFAKKELINVVGPNGGEPQALPQDKIIMDLTPEGKDGKAARYVRKQFIKSLSGAGREGDGQGLLGHEEQPTIKYMTAYCNDWKHGVPTEQFGINAREISTTKLYEKVNALLAQWKGEHTDYYCHQALCQDKSNNLTASPTSLSQSINSNWYVPGGTTAQQPKYAATTATLTDNVGVALKAVTYTSIKLTVPRILQLGSWAQSQYIKKISLPGLNKKGYFFLMHPMDFDALLDPSVSGSFQAYWITGAALQDTAKLIQSQVGMIGDILCVRDERAPTATLAGSASSYALTFGYLMMGRVDTRATGTTANTHFNINSLLGENALAKFEAEAMHYEDQLDEYKQFKNVGIFGTDSYQIPKFDIDTGTDTSMQQESSIIVPTQRA